MRGVGSRSSYCSISGLKISTVLQQRACRQLHGGLQRRRQLIAAAAVCPCRSGAC